EDVVRRVVDRDRHGALDRRRRRLVRLGARVRQDAARRNRAAPQRPDEAAVPFLALLRSLDGGEGSRDALVGRLDVPVDRLAGLGLGPVLRIPDTSRCFLERNVRDPGRFDGEGNVQGLVVPSPLSRDTVPPKALAELDGPAIFSGEKLPPSRCAALSSQYLEAQHKMLCRETLR